MNSQLVKVPQRVWFDDDELELNFPASWNITVCHMEGHSRPPLNNEGIQRAFANPVGIRSIRDLARGKQEVAIVFDDMSRPTRVAQIVPFVLQELEDAGIDDRNIRFIASLGTHGAHNRIDFAKKLGESVLARFPVFNHNPYENCTYLGTTSRGTPVEINNEYVHCDFRIGIGSILPHPLTGFSGGGKIIFPGVASVDSIAWHHGNIVAQAIAEKGTLDMWLAQFEDNIVRLDLWEAARIARLDVKIDVLMNARAQITDVFVGDPESVQLQGVKLAKKIYATRPVGGQDVAVLNTYAKASEAFVLPFTSRLLKESGGDLVLIANAPEGQVTHYLAGSFGTVRGGRLWVPRTGLPSNVNRIIVYTEYIDRAGVGGMLPPDAIVWTKTWSEVLDLLSKTHGEKANVAVLPDATMQYFIE